MAGRKSQKEPAKQKQAHSGRRELISHFIVFFCLMALVITSSFILFFTFSDYKIEPVSKAAVMTVGNIVFMSLLFALIDTARRYFMITKPIRKINHGIEQVMKGDFTTRIPYVRGEGSSNQFDQIITGLNRMITELGSVETLQTDFISSVSHELKTPLSVIQNYSTLMQSPDITAEQRSEYSGKITEQTKRLTSLITNILKLNKLENQNIYPQMEQINLTEAVCESMLDFESEWENKEIEIETKLEEDLMIHGDKELLSLVWNNLMSNAIKFTPKGGKITIETGKSESPEADVGAGGAFVRISDTGCGMDKKTLGNIFRKFFQGDTSHQQQGNGLGLSIASRVIDIHGGRIDVKSEPDKGSTFTVFL